MRSVGSTRRRRRSTSLNAPRATAASAVPTAASAVPTAAPRRRFSASMRLPPVRTPLSGEPLVVAVLAGASMLCHHSRGRSRGIGTSGGVSNFAGKSGKSGRLNSWIVSSTQPHASVGDCVRGDCVGDCVVDVPIGGSVGGKPRDLRHCAIASSNLLASESPKAAAHASSAGRKAVRAHQPLSCCCH